MSENQDEADRLHAMYYHEYVPKASTPEEALATIERIAGPAPEEFVTWYWLRVAEIAAQQAAWEKAAES